MDAGLGYSGFAVVDNVLFSMGADGDTDQSNEFVIAVDAVTGAKRWQTSIGTFLENMWGGGPRSTPSVADGRIIAMSARGDLVCLKAADGSELWRVSLTEMGGRIPSWGYCESALIEGDHVIVTPGGERGTVVCLRLADGGIVWQSAEITDAAHYSSAIAVDHFGKRMIIQLVEKRVFGLDAGSGKLLWQHDFPGSVAVIPTPIYDNGTVYVTAGYGAGCLCLNITADNTAEKLYENKIMKNHHGGVLLLDGFLYGHSDDRGIICQKLESGEEVWSDKKRNSSKGAVAYADGMLYCLEENTGDCILLEAGPKEYNEVSRFRLDPQTTKRSPHGRIWTHPVICNGRLYLRDQEIISCYRISE